MTDWLTFSFSQFLLIGCPPVSVPCQDIRKKRPKHTRVHLFNCAGKRAWYGSHNWGVSGNACDGREHLDVATVWDRSCALLEELSLGHGSLGRAKLLSLPQRCGQYPMPVHSLMAAATTVIETAMAVLHPLPQAPSLFLSVASQPVFPPLWSYTAVLSRSASGAPVGREQTTVTVWVRMCS